MPHYCDENNFTYVYGNTVATVCELLKQYHGKTSKTPGKIDQAELGLKLFCKRVIVSAILGHACSGCLCSRD